MGRFHELVPGVYRYGSRLKKPRVTATLFQQKKADINGDTFAMKKDGDWYCFEFTGSARPARLRGNLLFAPEDELTRKRSFLFEEQYMGREQFEGDRFRDSF